MHPALNLSDKMAKKLEQLVYQKQDLIKWLLLWEVLNQFSFFERRMEWPSIDISVFFVWILTLWKFRLRNQAFYDISKKVKAKKLKLKPKLKKENQAIYSKTQ